MKALAVVAAAITIGFGPGASAVAKKEPLTAKTAAGKYHAFTDTDTTVLVRLNPGGKATVTKTSTQADATAPTKLLAGTWFVKDAKTARIVVKFDVYEDELEYVAKSKHQLLDGYHASLNWISSKKSGSPIEPHTFYKYPLRFRKGL